MNIEVEAALQDLYEVLEWSEPTHPENAQEAAEKAAVRAYGAARELKSHVDACGDFIYAASVAGYAGSQPMSEKVYCGGGPDSPDPDRGRGGRGRSWLCDVAREIEEGR